MIPEICFLRPKFTHVDIVYGMESLSTSRLTYKMLPNKLFPGCYRYDSSPYGMDYYDDRYERLFGNPLSKFARELLRKYRYKDVSK